jgi:hypothetical protein
METFRIIIKLGLVPWTVRFINPEHPVKIHFFQEEENEQSFIGFTNKSFEYCRQNAKQIAKEVAIKHWAVQAEIAKLQEELWREA